MYIYIYIHMDVFMLMILLISVYLNYKNGYSYDRCCVHSHVCIIIYELMFMFSLVSVNTYLSSHTSSFDQHHK